MSNRLLHLQFRLNNDSAREFELISFSKDDSGNYAVIHFLDESDPTPWVVVRNLALAMHEVNLGRFSGSSVRRQAGYEWNYGFYFENRRHAERKFFEMVGVLKERKTK